MQNITVTFSNLTADEAANLFAALQRDYSGDVEVVPPAVEPVQTGAQESTPAPAKKPRGRPRKAADKTPPNQEMELLPEAPAKEPEGITLISMRKALSDLLEAKDMAACAQVLAEFGATRISELKPEQYANVRDRALQEAKA